MTYPQGPALRTDRLTGKVRRLESVCSRLVTSPRFVPALLIAVLILESGTLLLQARSKLFWYDELVTLNISALRPLSLLWKALWTGADGMPPGYYAIVESVRVLPGDPHIILRLPSIAGYILSLLGAYWFVSGRLPAVAALAAVLLMIVSPFRDYALEARPYSLLVGFLAIAAAAWQRIGGRRFMLPLTGLSLLLAVACHYLAVVAILSFAGAELARTLLSRRMRWAVWAVYAVASAPFFLDLPLLLKYREVFGGNFWSRPAWSAAILTYKTYLGLYGPLAIAVIAFFAFAIVGVLLHRFSASGETPAPDRFPVPEILLAGGLLFYPALLVVLAKLSHAGYTDRYGWPSILGLVWGSVYALRGIWRSGLSVPLLSALLLAVVVQSTQDARVALRQAGREDVRWTTLAELASHDPGIPIVMASGKSYLEAVEYAPPEVRARLLQVVDRDIAVRLAGADTLDRTARLLSQFIPLRVEDLTPFQVAHRRFLLYSGGGFDWMTRYLIEQRYQLKLLWKGESHALYLAER